MRHMRAGQRITNTVAHFYYSQMVEAYEAVTGSRIDTAVPQPWFDANREEIHARGGVVWEYVKGDHSGRPLYHDQISRRLGFDFKWEPETGEGA